MKGSIIFEIAPHVDKERALRYLEELAGSLLQPYTPNVATWFEKISVAVDYQETATEPLTAQDIIAHDHREHDGKAYWTEDGRLVKHTYADGCRRVAGPIPEAYRAAFPDPSCFNDLRRSFLTISTIADRGKQGDWEGMPVTWPFYTEPSR